MIRIVVQAVVPFLLGGNGVAQPRDPVKAGIDVVPCPDGCDGLGLDRRRHRRIAHALGKIDAPDAVALHAHGANLRLHRARRQLAEGKAGGRDGLSQGRGDLGRMGHGLG